MFTAAQAAADNIVTAQLTLHNLANGVKLELHAPLSALLDQNNPQDAANVMTKLQHADLLWRIPKSAQCTFEAPVIQSERLAQLLQRQSSEKSQQENQSRVPASLPRQPAVAASMDGDKVSATYLYTCVKPEQLKGMNINVMQVFPGIQHVDIQLSSTNEERGTRAIRNVQLVPPRTQVDW